MEKLKKIECDPVCGFSIQSHDEKEVVNVAMQHAKAKHNMDMPVAEMKKMMKSI